MLSADRALSVVAVIWACIHCIEDAKEAEAMEFLALSGLLFLLIHILPSTPLRRSAINLIGEGAYLGVFSLLSVLSIWWWVQSFNATAYDAALWSYPAWWPWLKALLLLFAAVLLVGGFTAPNPSIPRGGALLGRSDLGQGVFAITRHPGMWGVGLWAIAHLISQPNWRGFWFFGLFAITAIGGSYLQEKRKERELGEGWARFEAKTSFVPFVAILQGRASLSLSSIGWWRIGVAVLIWAMLLHLHVWLFAVPPLPGLAG
jgi:uncharacterized membrane protein